MTKKNEREAQKSTKYKSVEDFLREYPKPPPEHTYELKMEKELKRVIKEMEKKKQQ